MGLGSWRKHREQDEKSGESEKCVLRGLREDWGLHSQRQGAEVGVLGKARIRTVGAWGRVGLRSRGASGTAGLGPGSNIA